MPKYIYGRQPISSGGRWICGLWIRFAFLFWFLFLSLWLPESWTTPAGAAYPTGVEGDSGAGAALSVSSLFLSLLVAFSEPLKLLFLL